MLVAVALYNTSKPCILAFKKGIAVVTTLATELLPLLLKLITSRAWYAASNSSPVASNTFL